MQSQTITGWRALFRINGNIVAAGFVLDYSIETNATVVHGIDNILPSELAPEKISVSMNIQVYRTPENDPVAARIAPLGDAPNPQDEFAKSPYITVELRDRTTDKTIIYLPRAWITRRSGSVQAEGILIETWAIKSIGFYGPGGQVSGLLGKKGVLADVGGLLGL